VFDRIENSTASTSVVETKPRLESIMNDTSLSLLPTGKKKEVGFSMISDWFFFEFYMANI